LILPLQYYILTSMIGKLKGVLSTVTGNVGLIETPSGVSYEAYLLPAHLTQHKIGQAIEVFTYLQVRDDALILFGFSNTEQLAFFKLLLTVSGVGPKTAYSVLSHTRITELFGAVRSNDVAYFTQVPGLGKKTAMKIILELSQKIKSEFKMIDMQLSDDDKTAVDALVALGYTVHDARNEISKLPKQITVEEKIKLVLRRKQ
jgi:Holliday junction DNA helicase RuvA